MAIIFAKMRLVLLILRANLKVVIHRAILGLVNALLSTYSTPVAYAFPAHLLVYEHNEQEHLHDKAFINIWGWLLGLGCGSFAFRFL